jgi:hypothetical protein
MPRKQRLNGYTRDRGKFSRVLAPEPIDEGAVRDLQVKEPVDLDGRAGPPRLDVLGHRADMPVVAHRRDTVCPARLMALENSADAGAAQMWGRRRS